MSEEDAKTKWCPFVRFRLTGTEAPVNRDAPERDEGNVFSCIGSACMAWRWKIVANPAWKPDTNQMATWLPTNPYAQTPSGIESTTDGYCGLAGRP